MQTSPPTEIITGLGAIADRYDVLICDVWGVVHNGEAPFASTVEALQSFRMACGPVVLLTNAPRLADDVKLQFDRIGVPHDCYDVLVTSGQGAREDLEQRASSGEGLRVYHLGPDRDRAVRDGLPIRLSGPEDADIVLCTGLFDDETERPDDYREMLGGFRARGLEFLCANPDIVVRRGSETAYCAGALAQAYAEIGGKVKYFGKPYAPVFELALAKARALAPAKRPLMIGDGLRTDIKGANAMGWDALFVGSGVDGFPFGQMPRNEAVAQIQTLLGTNGVHAHWAIEELRW